MINAGLLSLVLPEPLGGAGLGPVETAVVLTEVGRNVAAVPALATLALGVLPLVRMGNTEQQQEVLAELEQGAVLTGALNEVSTPMPAVPATTARADGEAFLVNGRKVAVPYAAQAYRMLVPTSGGVLLIIRTPTASRSPALPPPPAHRSTR